MAAASVSLNDLIGQVADATSHADPLGALAVAAETSAQLNELADQLVEHFVEQARLAGASWTDVGQQLGVSKQAVQKRFVSRDDDAGFPTGRRLNRFTPRAQSVIKSARSAAAANRCAEVGNEHLVIGMLSEPDGLASRAIISLGGSPAQLRLVMDNLTRPGLIRGRDKRARVSRAAKKTIELSLREAGRLDHGYIGTEHLLLGLLRNDGAVAAGVLVGQGITHVAVDEWVVATLAEMTQTG